MTPTCPECGSSKIVDDNVLVCEDCGFVISEVALTTTLSDEVQGTDVPYYASTEVIKRPCRNLIKGLWRVRALCRILRLPKDMEAGSVALFEQAYNLPNFLFVSLQKKEVLAGCSVLAITRQHNWPIAMGTIVSLLEADQAMMGVVYQELVKSLNIEANATGIMDLLESYCHGFKLGPTQVDAVFSEPSKRLVERTSSLVELAADTWLVTGRTPQPILMAAIYLAWQSLNPVARAKFTLAKFCKMAKVLKGGAPSHTAQKRVVELRGVLCKLGQELPWLRGASVQPCSVVTLVEDILKHRHALLHRAMKSKMAAMLAELSEGPEDDASYPQGATPAPLIQPSCPEGATPAPLTHPSCPEGATPAPLTHAPCFGSATFAPLTQHSQGPKGPTLPDRTHCLEGTTRARLTHTTADSGNGGSGEGPLTSSDPQQGHQPALEAQEPPAEGVRQMEENAAAAERTSPADPEAQDWQLAECHWGKRYLFVPPCVRNPKRQRVEPAGPEVTGDEEISDSEIESYIRSPQEIRDFKEAQQRLQEEEEDDDDDDDDE